MTENEHCDDKISDVECELEKGHDGKHEGENPVLGRVRWGMVEDMHSLNVTIEKYRVRMEEERNNYFAVAGMVLALVVVTVLGAVAWNVFS